MIRRTLVAIIAGCGNPTVPRGGCHHCISTQAWRRAGEGRAGWRREVEDEPEVKSGHGHQVRACTRCANPWSTEACPNLTDQIHVLAAVH
jgi:hypothetical protein